MLAYIPYMDPMGYSSLNGMGQTMGYLSQHSQHDLMKNVDESSNMDGLFGYTF